MSEPEAPQLPNPDGAGGHLDRLLAAQTSAPWFRSFAANIQDFVRSAKLPPLEITAMPVAVKDIWPERTVGSRSVGGSVLLHAVGIAILIALAGSKPVRTAVRNTITLVAPPSLTAYIPQPIQPHGGGGGGDGSLTPASRGQAPRAAAWQYVPPAAVTYNQHPVLQMEPTLVMQADLPQVNMSVWGDPAAPDNLAPSNGPGKNGGIGTGRDGGIGPGDGPGSGAGRGGGLSGVYQIADGVSRPVAIYTIEPEYSEEARKAKFQGTVVLSIVIDEQGLPRDFHVKTPLGMGLDEKAIEAVRKWRFRPGRKDGRPVAVQAGVLVTFRLL